MKGERGGFLVLVTLCLGMSLRKCLFPNALRAAQEKTIIINNVLIWCYNAYSQLAIMWPPSLIFPPPKLREEEYFAHLFL